MNTKEILAAVRDGKLNVEQAALQLKLEPFQEMGFAKIDHHRALRQGSAEVIYGASKTPEQIASIAAAMAEHGGQNILITRMHPEAEEIVRAANPGLWYDPLSRIGIVNKVEYVDTDGYIVVASGGTSDQPVCEEAALTAEAMGNRVVRMYDVGVAGLQRLLSRLDVLIQANVVIAVAGMEGALASVVGGLVDCPVIGVPTSVGYGASFGGVSALLSMLNSCASGVSVVNIDNGFGAGFLASRINHRTGSTPVPDTKKENE
ncbi:MAG TPA: nickel pincer cofactor biosynthesis protein LarB [Candidatus Faecivivens stercorigallinarum]|nr:nickel pincer cofactor biosynthesis protein LarB [Candidatus Faecivivens stercorigallinarum]